MKALLLLALMAVSGAAAAPQKPVPISADEPVPISSDATVVDVLMDNNLVSANLSNFTLFDWADHGKKG